MKRFIALLLACLLLAMVSGCVMAEEFIAQPDDSVELEQEEAELEQEQPAEFGEDYVSFVYEGEEEIHLYTQPFCERHRRGYETVRFRDS